MGILDNPVELHQVRDRNPRLNFRRMLLEGQHETSLESPKHTSRYPLTIAAQYGMTPPSPLAEPLNASETGTTRPVVVDYQVNHVCRRGKQPSYIRVQSDIAPTEEDLVDNGCLITHLGESIVQPAKDLWPGERAPVWEVFLISECVTERFATETAAMTAEAIARLKAGYYRRLFRYIRRRAKNNLLKELGKTRLSTSPAT